MSNRTYTQALNDGKAAGNFPYIYDSTLITTGSGRPLTGAWRPYTTADISNSTVNVSGLSLSVGSVAVTGGQITVTNGNITVVNPVLATSGNSTIINTAPIPISGVVQAQITAVDTGNRSVQVVNTAPIPFSGSVMNIGGFIGLTGTPIVTVTGTQVSVLGTTAVTLGNAAINVTGTVFTITTGTIGGNVTVNSVAITGAPVVTLTGVTSVQVDYTRPVYVTGSFATTSSSSTAVTGFSPLIAPLAISGVVQANVTTVDTGNRAVNLVTFSPTLAPLPVSGAFTASVSDTGNRAVNLVTFSPTLAPLPVSGSFTATPGNTAVTGGSIIAIDTGVRYVFLTNTAPIATSGIATLLAVPNQVITASGGFLGVTGVVSTLITNTAPIAFSGVATVLAVPSQIVVGSGGYIGVTGTVTTNANVTNPVFSTAITGNPIVSLTGVIPVTILSTVPQVIVNSGGYIGVTGVASVNIVSSITQSIQNSGGWVGLTGTANFTITGGQMIGIDTGNRSSFIVNTAPIAVSGVFAATTDNTTVVLAQASGNALALIANQLLSGVSGALTANLNGAAPVSGLVGITNTAPIAISGVVNTTVSITSVAVTGFSPTIAPLAVSGNFGALSVSNPLGVTGTARDLNPIYSGIATYNFLAVGGRVVNPSGIGAITTGYSTGSFAMLNMSPQGAVYVSQGNLDRNYDTVTTYSASTGILTTAIVSGAAPGPLSAGLVFSNNPNRRSWMIQNLGTGTLMVKMGNTAPTTGNANIFLYPGSGVNDGRGQIWNDAQGRWTGPVFVSGLTPGFATNYTAWEL